jgi:glycosyltransferase involved in cell wall biosynthesis
MRICMFNNLFPPVKSGSSHFTLMLSRNLVARGHQVSVVTARLPGTALYEELDGIAVHRLPCLLLPALEIAHGFKYLSYTLLPGALRRVMDLSRDHDILHQHGQIFDTALLSAFVAKRLGKPLLTTIHTPVHHTQATYLKILATLDRTAVRHLIAKHADVLIAPDQTVVENIAERYAHPWVERIPYGIAPLSPTAQGGQRIRDRYSLGDRPVIVSLGHVHNLRDRCDLIAAMPAILRAVPGTHLLIVGDVLTQKPQALVDSLGLREHVTLAGGAPHHEIADYLSAATIEAHWLNETPGLGIAAMEAMSAGKAVVSSIGPDDLGTGLLRDGENIRLIQPGSVDSIAGAVIPLLRDPALRERVGTAGQRLILDHFSWDSVTSQQERLYQQVLARRA